MRLLLSRKRITDDPKLHLKALSERLSTRISKGGLGRAQGIGRVHLVHHGCRRGLCRHEHDVRGGGATHERDRDVTRARVQPDKHSHRFLVGVGIDCVIGAAIGIVLALPLNFVSTGTSNWVTFSEIAFNFRVTLDLMIFALIFGASDRVSRIVVAVNSRITIQDRRRVTSIVRQD